MSTVPPPAQPNAPAQPAPAAPVAPVVYVVPESAVCPPAQAVQPAPAAPATVAVPREQAHHHEHRHEEPPAVYFYSHSQFLYWWPVWATGYLMAVLTRLNGDLVTIGDTQVWFHRSKNVGVLFTLTF